MEAMAEEEDSEKMPTMEEEMDKVFDMSNLKHIFCCSLRMEKFATMEREQLRLEDLLSENAEPLLNKYKFDNSTLQRITDIENKLQNLRTLHENEQKHAEMDEQNTRQRLQEIDIMLATLHTPDNEIIDIPIGQVHGSHDVLLRSCNELWWKNEGGFFYIGDDIIYREGGYLIGEEEIQLLLQ